MQSGYCRAGCLGSYSFMSLRRTILNPDFKFRAFILQDFDEHKFVHLISSIGDGMNLLSEWCQFLKILNKIYSVFIIMVILLLGSLVHVAPTCATF
jgi:hypothetical protein